MLIDRNLKVESDRKGVFIRPPLPYPSLRFKGRRPFWPKTDDSVLVKDGKDDSTSTQISLLFSAETGQGLILEVKVALN